MLNRLLTCLAFLCVALPAVADKESDGEAKHDARETLAQIAEAYGNTNLYEAKVTFTLRQSKPRQSTVQTQELKIAFDREAGKLLIDRPDYQMLVQGEDRYFRHQELLGRYLKSEGVELSIGELFADLRIQPQQLVPMVDVTLLTDSEPLSTLGLAGMGRLQQPAADTVTFKTMEGTLTLTFDPETKLVKRASMDVNAALIGGSNNSVVGAYDIELLARNEALSEEAFAFDMSGEEHTSFRTFVSDSGPGAAGALIGKAAPDIELKTLTGGAYQLSEDKHEVIFLEFWATNCPPCRYTLPMMEALTAWAAKEKKDVAFYTVNQGEPKEKIAAFMADRDLSLPVLLDADKSVSMQYMAFSIPHMVLIKDGKIVDILVGYREGMQEELQAQISKLLEE